MHFVLQALRRPIAGLPVCLGALAMMTSGGGGLRAQDCGLTVKFDLEAWLAILPVRWIAYGNGRFVRTSPLLYAPPGGTTVTSPDGFHWNVHARTNGVSVGTSTGVVAGSNNFFAIGNSNTNGYGAVGTDGVMQFSADGVVWGQPLTIPSVPLNGAAYGNSLYVAVGQSGGSAAIVTSSDGATWSSRTFSGLGPLRAVTVGGGTFVAVGDSGTVLTSTNGLDWASQSVVPGTNIVSVAYGGGTFVIGAPPYALTSTNGINWAMVPGSGWLNPLRLGHVAYGSGCFVAVYSSFIWVSRNGADWALTYLGSEHLDFVDLAYGAGTFAVLDGNEVVEGTSVLNVFASYRLAGNMGTNGAMELTVNGGAGGQQAWLQAATNLPTANWVDLLAFTNRATATRLEDTGATNYSQRFYRVRLP